MTEAAWLADDLWDHFNAYDHRDRNKLRALTCACARQVLHMAGTTAPPVFADIVEVAERYSSGQATRAELLTARKCLRKSIKELDPRA